MNWKLLCGCNQFGFYGILVGCYKIIKMNYENKSIIYMYKYFYDDLNRFYVYEYYMVNI